MDIEAIQLLLEAYPEVLLKKDLNGNLPFRLATQNRLQHKTAVGKGVRLDVIFVLLDYLGRLNYQQHYLKLFIDIY